VAKKDTPNQSDFTSFISEKGSKQRGKKKEWRGKGKSTALRDEGNQSKRKTRGNGESAGSVKNYTGVSKVAQSRGRKKKKRTSRTKHTRGSGGWGVQRGGTSLC